MMFLQQGPAETTDFMILGFAVIFGVMLVHVWSMYSRANRLKKDLEVLEEVDPG